MNQHQRKPYAGDLTDAEWTLVESLIPAAKQGGRRRSTDMREVLNAIFYVLKTGCQWYMLPHDLPSKGTVYHYFNTWRSDGTWQRMTDALREQLRVKLGREPQPSGAIVDSQSVKTTEKGGAAAMMAARKSKGANGI